MIEYRAAGRMNAATTAAANDVAVHIWNPSSTKGIYVKEIHFIKQGAATADSECLVRTTTAGTTPGATVTPDIDNDANRAVAPVSGALLYTANFATEPTVASPALMQTNLPAAIGAGFIWVFSGDGIFVPQGTGLGVASPVATIIQIADFSFVWTE